MKMYTHTHTNTTTTTNNNNNNGNPLRSPDTRIYDNDWVDYSRGGDPCAHFGSAMHCQTDACPVQFNLSWDDQMKCTTKWLQCTTFFPVPIPC